MLDALSIYNQFTKLELNYYDLIRTTTYSCTCSECVEFKFYDFEKHWKNNFSNLEKIHFVGATDHMSFIDFYCPSCKLSTTIQYDMNAGGQHGEFWFTIKNVIIGKIKS